MQRKPLVHALAACGLICLSPCGSAAPRADAVGLGYLTTSEYAFSRGTTLNAGGQVVGTSRYFSGEDNLGDRAFLWSDGIMSNLGSLGADHDGYASSSAIAINDIGQVVGYSSYYAGVASGDRAFLWSNGTMVNLGSLGTTRSGFGRSYASALNASGQVVGSSDYYVNGVSKGPRAFLWSNGTMTNLGSLGTHYRTGAGASSAVAVNAVGQVAGNSRYYDANGIPQGERAFLWSDGVMVNLGTLDVGDRTGSSFAQSLNDSGQVAGNSTYFVNGDSKGGRAFLWSRGTMTDLGCLGTDNYGVCVSSSVALNASGQVAGASTVVVDGVLKGRRAVLWSNGTITNLGTLGTGGDGERQSYASALNASGQVVGVSDYYEGGMVSYYRAFLWVNGTMHRLDSFAPTGWIYTAASSINDFGQVAGTGYNGGAEEAFLFTPHPDWEGSTGNWSDASRWNYAGMGAFGFTPGVPHKVVIRPTSNATIDGPSNATVASLSVFGDRGSVTVFRLNGGQITTAEGMVLGANAVLTGAGYVGGTFKSLADSTVRTEAGDTQHFDSAAFDGTVINDGEIQVKGVAEFSGRVSGVGTLSGSGVAAFMAGSSLEPGGNAALVTVGIKAVFAEASRIGMDLGGVVAGRDHDKLVFAQDVTLGGDLVVAWYHGFSAQAGDDFDLFDWNGTVTGRFTNVLLPSLADGLVWRTENLYTSGLIGVAAVPEPESYAQLLAGLCLLSAVARRRSGRRSAGLLA